MTMNPQNVISEQSLLHFYSIGIVAANKVMSSNDIMVTPYEHLAMLDGEITTNPQPTTAQGVDASGKSYSTQVILDNAIEATWYDSAGSNRSTSPDVRRGERVKIWRYGDVDKFYWTTMGMDNHLRKLETVRHTFSGTTDESQEKLTPENSYYHEVSSHNGIVTMSTSKANGEAAAYTAQIDAKNGFVHVQDDAGQVFELDTKNRKMTMVNADGSIVQVNKQNILFQCSDTITLAGAKKIVMRTEEYDVATQKAEITATTDFTVTTPLATFNTASVFKISTATFDVDATNYINFEGLFTQTV